MATTDDLFQGADHAGQRGSVYVPLAERMRPSSLDEVVGQAHLLGLANHCAWHLSLDDRTP